MPRRLVRLALVPALLLAAAPTTGASALYCGYWLDDTCRRVCVTHPGVERLCARIDPAPR